MALQKDPKAQRGYVQAQINEVCEKLLSLQSTQ